MFLIKMIRDALADSRLKGVGINTEQITLVHREILQEKKMIQGVFREFYDEVIRLDKKFFNNISAGQKVEVGSGSSFFKLYYPDITTSDIKKTDLVDMEIDAQNMSFKAESVSALYGINCFHHFPDPEKFFTELGRVLIKGGGCILIDPYYGQFADFFYKRVFDTETFDKNQESWETDYNAKDSKGPNQALSYIVFKRDYALFAKKYPDLEIVYTSKFNNYIRYLVSGGLNFKPLLPKYFIPMLKAIEFILKPVSHLFALHHLIVIRKKS